MRLCHHECISGTNDQQLFYSPHPILLLQNFSAAMNQISGNGPKVRELYLFHHTSWRIQEENTINKLINKIKNLILQGSVKKLLKIEWNNFDNIPHRSYSSGGENPYF